MADDVKTVRGKLVDSGATVTVSEETAEALGSSLEREGSSKSSTSKSTSSSK